MIQEKEFTNKLLQKGIGSKFHDWLYYYQKDKNNKLKLTPKQFKDIVGEIYKLEKEDEQNNGRDTNE